MVAEGWSEVRRLLEVMWEFSAEFLTVYFHKIVLHFFFTNNSVAVETMQKKGEQVKDVQCVLVCMCICVCVCMFVCGYICECEIKRKTEKEIN